MRPVELQLMDLAPEARLLDGTEKLLRYNGSSLDGGLAEEAMKSFLQFPTPTIAHDLGRNELRKRLRVDPHNIPYGEQTGPTKYAPMPKRAGSTIADRSPTPQYPPFPFSIATTYLPAPTVQYTDTAYLTWTTHSIENTVKSATNCELISKLIQYCFRLLLQLHPLWTRGCRCGWNVGRIDDSSSDNMALVRISTQEWGVLTGSHCFVQICLY